MPSTKVNKKLNFQNTTAKQLKEFEYAQTELCLMFE